MIIRKQLLLALASALAGAAWAQQTTATFRAVVTDPTGATVPQASVTLTHQEMGTAVARNTSTEGEALFDFLRVGAYRSGSKRPASSASKAAASSFRRRRTSARRSCSRSALPPRR